MKQKAAQWPNLLESGSTFLSVSSRDMGTWHFIGWPPFTMPIWYTYPSTQ